jgi:hypothetical protein
MAKKVAKKATKSDKSASAKKSGVVKTASKLVSKVASKVVAKMKESVKPEKPSKAGGKAAAAKPAGKVASSKAPLKSAAKVEVKKPVEKPAKATAVVAKVQPATLMKAKPAEKSKSSSASVKADSHQGKAKSAPVLTAVKSAPVQAPMDKSVEKALSEAPTLYVEAAAKEAKVKKSEKLDREAVLDGTIKWIDLKNKYGKEKAVPYSMSSQYRAMQPIQHKVLGWGYIFYVLNDRLEVLFEQGVKHLISNYKSS